MAAMSQWSGKEVISRLDRIPVWPYPASVLWVIGIGYLLAFFDITNIGFGLPVIVKQFHISAAASAIPITASLLGYILGAYLNSTLADLKGRKVGIVSATILFTAGSVATALSFDWTWLIIWRFITGMGIGAEIAAISAYMSEMSPAPIRGRFTGWANVFAFSGFAVVPFVALALVPHFSWGWRGLFVAGALGGLTLIWSTHIAESPRWLLAHHREEEAQSIVHAAEEMAERKLKHRLPEPKILVDETHAQQFPTTALFKPPYVGRLFLLLAIWIFIYLSDYAWLGLAPTFLVDKGYSLSNSILFLLVTGIGYPVGSLLAAWLGDRFERKYAIVSGVMIWVVGLIVVGVVPSPAIIYIVGFFLSAALTFFFPLLYALTAESFSTHARASGVALTDGVGHVGGALAPILAMAAYGAFGASGFMMAFFYMATAGLIGAILLPFGIVATRKSLEVVHQDSSQTVSG